MSRALQLVDAGRVKAVEWTPLVRGAMEEGPARLLVARLEGAEAFLGRHQRKETVLAPALRGRPTVQRRVSGGRLAGLGEGMFGVALVLPDRTWAAETWPAEKLLNRGVRGLLAGLRSLGVSASYFGRDFVTVDSGQGGLLGFELDARGVVLVECVLAAETHWWPEASWEALPRRTVRGVPGPKPIERLVGRTSAELLQALARGHEEAFGARTSEGSMPQPVSVTEQPAPGLRWSAPREIPIGWMEAGVRLAGDLIARVAFAGDFLADSPGLAALEAALAGCEVEASAQRMKEVYAAPARTILGASLDDFAAALLDACGR